MNKKNVVSIMNMKKEGRKIAMLTCYDYVMAKLLSSQDTDILLVGDSLGVVKLGYENTLPVTVEDIIYHSKSVKRGNDKALLVADMPFMSYEISAAEAARNAARLLKEGGAEAVKVEGGAEIADKIKAMLDAKIPVMGHLGLTPQAVNKFGGHKVQCRDEAAAAKLVEDAKILEKTGVFAIVLEAIPEDLGKKVSETVKIPVIGIGAGRYCDGQVLVIDDMLGMFTDWTPKFVKKYANLGEAVQEAVKKYVDEVREGKFPAQENVYK